MSRAVATADSTPEVPAPRGCVGAWTFMPLVGKYGDGTYTVLDTEDYEWARDHRWHMLKVDIGGYAVRKTGPDNARRAVLLHREILGLEHGDPREVDHINRDKLDNRRANLRIVTAAEQQQNVPAVGNGPRGVTYVNRADLKNRWKARVKLDGVTHNLGYHATAEEAASAAAAFRAEHMPYATD